MAAAILEHFEAGTEVSLVQGSSGVLDVTAYDELVYSKKQLGVSKSEVDEQTVCKAIELRQR